MKKLYVVRHGHQEDHNLDERGKRQMKWVVEELKKRFVGATIAVVAANTSHVKQSAAIITGELGLERATLTDFLNPESLDRSYVPRLCELLQRAGEKVDVLVVVARTRSNRMIGHWLDTPSEAFEKETEKDRDRPYSEWKISDAYGCGYVIDYEHDTCEAVRNEVMW